MADLTAMPSSFSAGSTVKYRRSEADYPANGGWTLAVYVAGKSAAQAATVTTDGADYIVTFPATTTDDLAPGTYRWVERVSKAGEVFDIGAGVVEVTVNLATATAGAAQSYDERLLAAVNDLLVGKIPAGVESYTIGGRALTGYSLTELTALRNDLEGRVAAERAPQGFGRPVVFTFPPPGSAL